MKRLRNILNLLLVVCLLTGLLQMTALAEKSRSYLALGDSISTGYGLTNASTESFASQVAASGGYTLNNQAKDGNTISGILTQLAGGTLTTAVQSADLITITCGGNDLMGLLYTQIAASYNTAYQGNITAQDVASILANSSDAHWMMLLACAQSVLVGDTANGIPAFADSPAFTQGLTSFIQGLNQVMAAIRSVNPTAVVIVTTQYNPYKAFAGTMYTSLNTGIGNGAKLLSQQIQANASAAGYLVADVYTAFESQSENLCNASAATMNLDFHPNAAGHKVIAECVLAAFETHTHIWDSGEVTTEATCTKKGVKTYTCTLCDETKTESIAATGKHTYGAWETTREATVLKAGVKTKTCSVCGKKQTKSIKKLTATIKVNYKTLTLAEKQSTKVVKVTYGTGDSISSWKSSNTKVATVNKSGTITAKKKGTARITVKLKSGKSAVITVKVQKNAVETTKVAVNSKNVSLKKGETFQLKTTLSPVTSIQKVTYKSSDTSVASVSSKGKITAKKKGTATITVKAGKKSVKVKVTVKTK
ncbi:MAG: GDSL-type esterase/lipase family protein [Eubacteriales bacterium]|nr:GDSL-type esterase/lipase family protein [Eubacteriales bacterium]